jgi:phosphoribosylformimino-5-aminoimidazole carboxamide ribotide isomerase
VIVIPAIDLREGACVQLVGGSYADERVRLLEPARVAEAWRDLGFTWLHVVDLDAATGRTGDEDANAEPMREILEVEGLSVQAGGGIRSTDDIVRLHELGAERIVIGTRALEEPDWIRERVGQFPDILVVAADVIDRDVVSRGWTRHLGIDVLEMVKMLTDLPLAAIMVTAVHKEGRLEGTDMSLMEDVVRESTLPILASGGITTVDELRALSAAGVAAAILGMSLYTSAIDAAAVAAEFCA